jgi:NAD(P)-dependent dehydrogenase (short-subunit alcohol dehydrogenase family)
METPKVALITGAGSGIGLATAERLVADGYQVIGLGRRAQVLREQLPAQARALACDVSDSEAVDRIVEQVGADHGRIDALVNCAGLIHRGLLQDMSNAQMQSQINVNLYGTIHMARATLPWLKRSHGAMVNFSSTLSQHPVSGVSIYAATKGAIEAFSRALAFELAPDRVRVNVISPALVRSDIWLAAGMSEKDYQRLIAARAQDYPLGRVGEPKELADIVAFLLSSATQWITGINLPVDGGSSINTVRV